MRSLVLEGKQSFRISDFDEQSYSMEEVVVRVAYSGICGTDFDLFEGRPGSAAVRYPIVLGHEISGIIKYAPKGSGFNLGDRVVIDPNIYCGSCHYCRTARKELCSALSAIGVTRDGGFAEEVVVPLSNVYKIPDGLSLRIAAAVEPVSCVIHGLDLLRVKPYQNILVIGDGFIGMLFALLINNMGIPNIDLAGVSRKKLEIIKGLIPSLNIVDTTKDELSASGYDVIVEAVGSPLTQELAVAKARKGAQILFFGVGDPKASIQLSSYDIYTKQLTIKGSFINPDSFIEAITLLGSGAIDMNKLLNKQLCLEEVSDFLCVRSPDAIKATVLVNDNLGME